jgi:hypothetical protein
MGSAMQQGWQLVGWVSMTWQTLHGYLYNFHFRVQFLFHRRASDRNVPHRMKILFSSALMCLYRAVSFVWCIFPPHFCALLLDPHIHSCCSYYYFPLTKPNLRCTASGWDLLFVMALTKYMPTSLSLGDGNRFSFWDVKFFGIWEDGQEQ